MSAPSDCAYLAAPLPLAFAHRGGALTPGNEGIENSLIAFKRAHELGYRYLETDVHVTADRVPYVCHDAELDRLTGADEKIGDLNSSELDDRLIGGREPFIRLDVLLTELPAARFNIDIKADDAVESTCEVVRQCGASERVLLASFDHERLRRVRRISPEVATSGSSREVAMLKLVPFAILRRWWRSPAACVQVPHRHGPVTVVTPRFITKAHRLGMQVHVWTIDDSDEMRLLLDRGVDGIMTDRTDVLKDVLIDRGEWSQP